MDCQYNRTSTISHNSALDNTAISIDQHLDNTTESLITQDSPFTTSTTGALLISLKTEPMPRKETGPALLFERKSPKPSESGDNDNQATYMDSSGTNNNEVDINNTNTLVERRRGTCLYLEPSFCSAVETAAIASAAIPDKRSFVTPIKQQQQQQQQQKKTQHYYQPKQSRHSILAQIERQNALLEKDPKSICIQSNELRGHYSTVQQLVTDYQPLLYSPPLSNNNSDDDDLSDSGSDHWQQQQQIMDWAFWQAVIQDPIHVAKKKHLLSIKVVRAGIPSHARGLIWQAICQSDCLHLETAYGQLCQDRSPHERIIQRDLTRTYPTIDMFKQENGPGQQAMCRVLVAYSLYDAHVGYCQGLAFLVGPLLMNMPEPQAFCVFVRMMETYEMRSMFTLDMEGLQLRLYQFSCLLEEHLPNLAAHFNKHSIHAAMYASQWFLTLFAYVFPMELVTRIYDILFVEGAAETMMRVAIAMLQRSEHTILAETELEDLLDCVTTKKLCAPYAENWSEAILDAMALSNKITRPKLEHLENQYAQQGQQEKKKTEQVLASRLGSFWRRKSTRSKDTSSSSSLERSLSDGGGKGSRSTGNKRNIGAKLNRNFTRNSMQEVNESYSSRMAPPTPMTATIGTLPKSTGTMEQHDDVTEELLQALDQLRKEHSRTIDELFETRMDKNDVESERDALKMTIMELERRYQTSSTMPLDTTATTSTMFNTCTATYESNTNNISSDAMFIDFTPPTLPLPLTKNDGTLLTTNNEHLSESAPETMPSKNMITRTYSNGSSSTCRSNGKSNSDTSEGDFSETLTSSFKTTATTTTTTTTTTEDTEGDVLRTELVRVKVNHFESQQQCERLTHEVEDLQARLEMVNEGQLALVDKLVAMKSEMDELLMDKKRRQDKWVALVQENSRLGQQQHVQRLMEQVSTLEASLAATKVRLAECESAKGQPPRKNGNPDEDHDALMTMDTTSDKTMGNNGIGRSASLYGRMWHVISPKSQSFRTS
ncbi:rab-GTPase-TBC domain-domain-containing protein [Absidia repens]|uniref:Rab-GTPase-TBC domain-domain-containing protein n=1 Tax=Absidia repens TaxID=90262 RepID=A0A1X2IA16_9FUNG|nr:rab-GTPase-TBC domain-domain-containing protein [Absidia repens]